MREKTLFVCELCKTEYASLDEANRCEKHHSPPVKVKAGRYIALNNDGCRAPLEVIVVTKDGNEYIYRRTRR